MKTDDEFFNDLIKTTPTEQIMTLSLRRFMEDLQKLKDEEQQESEDARVED